MKRFFSILLVLLAVAAIGICVYSAGRPFATPWDFNINLENPTRIAQNDKGEAIIDSSSNRLLFLDNNQLVKGAATFDDLSSRAEKALDVEASDSGIYVLAANYHDGGQFISEELLLLYGFNGDLQEVIATEEVPLAEHRVLPAICDMDIDDNGDLYIARRAGHVFQLIKAGPENNYGTKEVDSKDAVLEHTFNSRIFDVSINSSIDSLALTTGNGRLWFYSNGAFECLGDSVSDFDSMLPTYLTVTSESSVVFNDSLTNNLYEYYQGWHPSASEMPEGAHDEIFTRKAGSYIVLLSNVEVSDINNLDGYLAITSTGTDSITFMDREGTLTTQVTSCGLSLPLALRIIFTWLAMLYLAILLVALVVRLRIFTNVWLKVAAVFTVALLVCVTVSYSQQLALRTSDSLDSELTALSQSVVQTSDGRVGDIISKVGDRKTMKSSDYSDNSDLLDELSDRFDVYLSNSASQGLNRFYRLFTVSQDGDISVLLDSTRTVQRGGSILMDELRQHIDETLPQYKAGSSDTFTVADEDRTCRYAMSPVYDSKGTFVGLCAFGCFYDTVVQQQFQDALELAMLAAVLAAACFLIISEGRKFQLSFDAVRQHRARGDEASAVSAGAHPVNFLVTAAASTDSLLAVIIVTHMAQESGVDAVVFTASGVLFLQSFGSLLGSAIYISLSKKLPARTVFLVAALLALVALAGCAVSVGIDNLPSFFVFKMVSGLTVGGILSEIAGNFATQTQLEQQRNESLSANRWGNLGSKILSVMVAGYLVDYFGDPAAYVFSFILAAGLLIAGVYILPRGFYFNNSGSKEKYSLQEELRIVKGVFNPQIFAVIAVLSLPIVLVGGYNSYLFPLMSSGFALKSSYITNLYVIARVLAYLLRGVPGKLFERGIDHLAITTASMSVVALTLLAFLVNKGLIWAIVALVIFAIMSNLANANISSLKSRAVEAAGYDLSELTPGISIVGKVLNMIQPVVIGWCLVSGSGPIACVILGVITLVCLLIFHAISRFAKPNTKTVVESA